MGHHLGSNCSRSLPAKGRISGYTELAWISQRVMRISSSDACRFRRTGVTEHRRKLIVYSALMLAARITLAHLLVSSLMSLPKSAAGPASTEPPRSARRALILGSARPALISWFRFSTISMGVLRGAPMPYQLLA